MSQTIIKQKQKKSKKKLNLPAKKIWMIIGLSICSVALIGGGVWWFIANNKTDDYEVRVEEKSSRDLTVSEKVNFMANQGDYEGGQKYLDEQLLSKANSDQEKASAYVEKAALALNAGKPDEARSLANQANDLHSSRESLNMLALISRFNDDKEGAIKYYEMVLATYSDEEKATDKGSLEYLDIEMNIGDLRK